MMMAHTLRELRQFREQLFETRLKGIRRVRDQNGEEIEYKSDAEMERAIRAVDLEIESFTRRIPHTIVFQTSKGL
jgi:hypothetical protein